MDFFSKKRLFAACMGAGAYRLPRTSVFLL